MQNVIQQEKRIFFLVSEIKEEYTLFKVNSAQS